MLLRWMAAMLRGVVVPHEREELVILDRQVQRGSRHEDAPVRLDGDPLEHQSQSGDGEELGFLLDDLENASGSYLAVEASKVLIFRLRRSNWPKLTQYCYKGGFRSSRLDRPNCLHFNFTL